MVVTGENSCVRKKSFYSGKVVVFGQDWLYSEKWLFLRKSGCIRAKVVELG